MRLFFDRKPVASFDDVLTRYKTAEFKSPTRSTVPLLSLLKHGGAVWSRIVEELTPASCAGELHLEFTVAPPRGDGTASHTDVMLVDGNRAVAFEAKWTEPRYEEVRDWLTRGDHPDNRRAVMNGWLSLLQPHATTKLHLDDFMAAVYQAVHRAASACYAGQTPTMAYIQFCPLTNGCDPEPWLMDDLCHLHTLLGAPEGFPFWFVEIVARPTPAFEQIRGLPKSSVETAEAVRNALLEGPLFQFTEFHLHRVHGQRIQAARFPVA
jgi:hypothetical protein